MLGSDLTYEAAGGGALRVKSDQSEKLAEGRGDLALGGEGIQTKFYWLIRGRRGGLGGGGPWEERLVWESSFR
jgi:hypothetical protein